MYKCFVFDFDGTIVDSNTLKKSLFFEILNNFDVDISLLEKEISIDGKSRNEIIRNMLFNYPEHNKVEAIRQYSKKSREAISSLKPNNFFFQIIEYCINNSIYLVLSSNTPENELIKIVKEMKIFKLFDEINGNPKSKTETLNKIIINNKFKSSEILVIGDGISDKESASENETDFHFVKNNCLESLLKKIIHDW